MHTSGPIVGFDRCIYFCTNLETSSKWAKVTPFYGIVEAQMLPKTPNR